MRIRTVAATLAGSAAIFVACAAEQAVTSSSPSDAGVVDAIADAFAVADAEAGPSAPTSTVDVVPCSGGIAEKSYPGRTKEDLARTVAMYCVADGSSVGAPPGYNCGRLGALWFRDGSVAAQCGSATSVTFVAPPPL